ncbi:hypothetical protein BUALT_Bualt06G0100400 [Buddleja alternifolia]|uniref:Uncharacterized protein n=1 Tax=Buddleja alternifolia TaxID=168488 RepID=A0AAV6XFL9_9LAMI|nr:hypothetical protein BUALT_Bualt06G0100400 [Buddleja alternifolia]
MEDTIVLYATPEHLNTISLLAKFISKHHPSIPIIIISTAAASAAATITAVPSITYHPLPTAALPPNFTTNPVELFFEIPRLNNPNLHQALRQISHKSKIKAFIIDFFCYPAFEVSTSLNIPTYFDFSTGAFGLCAMLYWPTIHEAVSGNIKDLNDFIHIPGCPPIHSSDFPEGMFYRGSNTYKHFLKSAINMAKSNGIIVNSFDAIAVRAKEALSNGLCTPNAPTPPIYFLGPLIDSQNGNAEHECLRWLDLQPSDSVIFLCFGRRGLFSAEQLKEIAIGLENSGHRFLWVFMVEEMKVALPLEEAEGGFVTAVELEEGVRELMDSETGRDVRQRIMEMKIAAEAAVRKDGSSNISFTLPGPDPVADPMGPKTGSTAQTRSFGSGSGSGPIIFFFFFCEL